MADTFDVIMAAYPSIGSAVHDFDALVRLVKDKTIASEGVILVEHDAEGQVRVTHTGDHLGRKGLGWGGGVGLVVGLFSPPLLASVVVGGLTGKFARHRGGRRLVASHDAGRPDLGVLHVCEPVGLGSVVRQGRGVFRS
jgi:hypothetical protein